MGIGMAFRSPAARCREEMRQGCDQVKIMMSGGVASPYDPLDSLQFSVDEVEAAVEEAHAFGAMSVLTPIRRKPSRARPTPAYVHRARHLIDDASRS